MKNCLFIRCFADFSMQVVYFNKCILQFKTILFSMGKNRQ